MRRAYILIALVVIMAGCVEGGGEDALQLPTFDLNGTFATQGLECVNTQGNIFNPGETSFIITQTGNDIHTVNERDGTIGTGTVEGETLAIEAQIIVAGVECSQKVECTAFTEDDGAFEITCEPTDFITVREAISAAGIEADSAELTMVPSTTVDCDAAAAAKVMRLVDALEDNDDVQKVYTNADIPEEVMAGLG